MADEIEITRRDGIEGSDRSAPGAAAMAYVGATPWHRLGTQLPPGCTIDEMMDAAKLRWRVRTERLATADGQQTDRWAVMRETDNRYLGDVGSRFVPLQNPDAFEWFRPFVDGGLASLETAGALFGGRRVWVLAKVNQPDDVIVPESDDRAQRYILLGHAHDGSMSVNCGGTFTRVVCQNTLNASLRADGSNMLRLRHTAGLKVALDAAQALISRQNGQWDQTAEAFRALSRRRVTGETVKLYLDAVFPAPKVKARVDAQSLMGDLTRDAASAALMGDMLESAQSEKRRITDSIMDLFEGSGQGSDLVGSKGTAWGAYNAVTEYLTHKRGRSDDQRAANVGFGDIGHRALAAATSTFLST